MIFEAWPRDGFKRNFVRGVFCGLLLVFAITSYFGAWRVPDDNANTTKGKVKLEQNSSGWGQLRLEIPSTGRKKVFAFVGVQTGFTKDFNNPKYIYELRREALRKTWFPRSQAALDEFEEKTGVVVKFVMGHSIDESREWDVKVEEQKYGKFLRLDVEEGYLQLADKTLLFIRTVVKLYEPEYILKVDDDVYFRLDRVPHAVRQWKAKKSDYVGCMKRGEVFKDPRQRWHEPQHPLIGDSYYTHTWGTTYAMSRRAAEMIAGMPNGSLRFFNNEDTSFGVWMLALNVTHFDDRRLCSSHCTESSIAVYDIPKCSGLCDPQTELAQLHTMADCQSPAVPDGLLDLPLEDEIMRVHGVVSRKSSLAP
ncbi:hypothetical protein BSKO_10812 [Bryopsis sp. KO-2023]|nr:hypothetical protein BSKO_10812 [Bryopsis sp. KO-2023]